LDEAPWDDPVRCAKLVECFTSHNLDDVMQMDLGHLSRRDLESVIQLLHGYYTQFVMDSPPDVREALRCSCEDVLSSMMIASTMSRYEDGELVLEEEVWEIVRRSPQLLRYLVRGFEDRFDCL
jgi:hypothetical protein